jgi:hypothetical protein
MVGENVVKVFEDVRILSNFLLSSPLLGESTRIPAHEGGCKDCTWFSDDQPLSREMLYFCSIIV